MKNFTTTNEQEALLLKDASMASMSIGQGLTALKKADFANKGYYY